MSFKAPAWTLLAVIAFTTVLLFNHWAPYQTLSLLAYAGIVLALCGLANMVLPFRFLGVRKRSVGALILAGGVALACAALFWPASMIRVVHAGSRLDEIMPEYQFSERHSARIHARPEQVVQAIRLSTFGDLKSLVTLLKIRGAVLGTPGHDLGQWEDKRILDGFAASQYLFDSREHEIAIFGIWNARANRRPDVHTLQQFVDYRDPGTVKMGFDFNVEQAEEGWSRINAETRVLALDDVSRGMAQYWRLMVPGSGILRLQWLEGIKKRAESLPSPRS